MKGGVQLEANNLAIVVLLSTASIGLSALFGNNTFSITDPNLVLVVFSKTFTPILVPLCFCYVIALALSNPPKPLIKKDLLEKAFYGLIILTLEVLMLSFGIISTFWFAPYYLYSSNFVVIYIVAWYVFTWAVMMKLSGHYLFKPSK